MLDGEEDGGGGSGTSAFYQKLEANVDMPRQRAKAHKSFPLVHDLVSHFLSFSFLILSSTTPHPVKLT